MCCTWLAENTGRKNDAKNRRLGTIPQLCRSISPQLIKACIDKRKKLVKQQYLLHMSPQYGERELRPTSGWDRFGSLGYPQLLSTASASWQRYCTACGVVGVSQTLRRWTEGATYVWQGNHHAGHWPAFLVMVVLCNSAYHYIFALWFLSFFLSFFLA